MSVQETLTFKVSVTNSGMSDSQISSLAKAIRDLSSIKFSGGNIKSQFDQINAGTKSAQSGIDQLTSKTKTLDSTLKSSTAGANQFSSAIKNLGAGTGSMVSSFDRARGVVPVSRQVSIH